MKKSLFYFFIFFLILGVFYGFRIFLSFYRPVLVGNVSVALRRGMSIKKISRLLDSKGLVNSEWEFWTYVQWKGLDREMKAGIYHFQGLISIDKLVLELQKGSPEEIRVIFPEGFSLRQTVFRLASVGLSDTRSLFALAYHPKAFEEWIGFPVSNLEGFLFPAGYRFRKGAFAKEILGKMVRQFQKVYGEEARRSREKGHKMMDTYTVLILASIVEKESFKKEELSNIASVFWNRYHSSWPLEADPTVRYAKKVWHRRLTRKDLKFDSPYNTYRHAGLPPTPICSPGRNAIRAALNPNRTKYFFFTAKGNGNGHRFSRSLSQHHRAVRLMKKERRRLKKIYSKKGVLP